MKIAFCKFAGLASGGVEKYLQTIALIYKKMGHEIDYYYTNAAPITSTTWVHPDNDKQREELLLSNGINLIPVNVDSRHHNTWHGTNFFDLFDESKYDFLVTAGNGESENPYNQLFKIKIIHTVHGDHPFNQVNIYKSVLLCNWQAERWVAKGGDVSKLEIIPSVVYVPSEWSKNFRKKYNIPQDALVYGFHQRNDDSISSVVSLDAFRNLQNENTYFAILGGSNVHKNFVNHHKIQNVVFAPHTSNVDEIHEFLDGIDVFAHCRNDGEVCSASIIEAMAHGLPLISIPGINMGHLDQLEGCGFIAYSLTDYIQEMLNLNDNGYRKNMSDKVIEKYDMKYRFDKVENQIMNLLN